MLTVEPVDSLLPQRARDASVNPLVFVALEVKEVLQQVQHLGHLVMWDRRWDVRRVGAFPSSKYPLLNKTPPINAPVMFLLD